jgi:hypothetical protein
VKKCNKKEIAFGEEQKEMLAKVHKQTRMLSSRRADTSNQQEVPALLVHRVPPVDTLNGALCEVVVVDPPDFAEEFLDSSKRAQLRSVAQLASALRKHSAEGRVGESDRSSHKKGPDQRAVETSGSSGDVLHCLAEGVDQVDAALLGAIKARNKAAKVDAGGEAEDCSHVLAKLPWEKLTSWCACHVQRPMGRLCEADLLTKKLNVLAQLGLIHVLKLERLEAGNLRDQVHDSVFATHELCKTRGCVCNELLAVGVSERWGLAQHRCAEDVNPRSESHVERRLGVCLTVQGNHLVGKIELVYQALNRLEMLVPWDIHKTVVEAPD